MDIVTACNILELETIRGITIDKLKKQYHKLAVLNHPDKNGNSDESTKKFQMIGEAYNLLKREIALADTGNEESYNSVPFENAGYMSFVQLFINELVQGKYHETITSIIKNILMGCTDISLQILDRETAMYIYDFFTKYRHILKIDDEMMIRIQKILFEKCKNMQVFLLNPSLQDILDNNIYKLVIEEKTYCIPLWHSELHFEEDIIIKCIPELPENIEIDDDNNIRIIIRISFAFSLFDKEFISVRLGQETLEIPMDKLRFKKVQTYVFARQGISKINEKNIYDIDKKSDIIATVIFTE
jgi:hypothetical protein